MVTKELNDWQAALEAFVQAAYKLDKVWDGVIATGIEADAEATSIGYPFTIPFDGICKAIANYAQIQQRLRKD